ncbi:MAG TPA: hypothetical protein VFS97_03550 [Nitrososphaeraceae archaeon]|nr:hypothetical protein [Nitrososphaeraceae archaeon]
MNSDKTILNLSLSQEMSYNWHNKLTYGIEELQRNLQDAEERVGNDEDVTKVYQEALDSVSKSREAISRFVGTFNKKYPGKDEEEV